MSGEINMAKAVPSKIPRPVLHTKKGMAENGIPIKLPVSVPVEKQKKGTFEDDNKAVASVKMKTPSHTKSSFIPSENTKKEKFHANPMSFMRPVTAVKRPKSISKSRLVATDSKVVPYKEERPKEQSKCRRQIFSTDTDFGANFEPDAGALKSILNNEGIGSTSSQRQSTLGGKRCSMYYQPPLHRMSMIESNKKHQKNMELYKARIKLINDATPHKARLKEEPTTSETDRIHVKRPCSIYFSLKEKLVVKTPSKFQNQNQLLASNNKRGLESLVEVKENISPNENNIREDLIKDHDKLLCKELESMSVNSKADSLSVTSATPLSNQNLVNRSNSSITSRSLHSSNVAVHIQENRYSKDVDFTLPSKSSSGLVWSSQRAVCTPTNSVVTTAVSSCNQQQSQPSNCHHHLSLRDHLLIGSHLSNSSPMEQFPDSRPHRLNFDSPSKPPALANVTNLPSTNFMTPSPGPKRFARETPSSSQQRPERILKNTPTSSFRPERIQTPTSISGPVRIQRNHLSPTLSSCLKKKGVKLTFDKTASQSTTKKKLRWFDVPGQ